ncbi:hypothetical protein A1D22_02080 [Pasteurellaceae bacterium LFhippo2]|nr:hypothetical protein [Pasteurellaceae bacterium LFhippo2]
MSAQIPVQNIWLLMLYASELFQTIQENQNVTIEDNPDNIPDLVAEILCYQVEKRLKRQLNYGYQYKSAQLTRVRGRINLRETETKKLLSKGRIACKFEELNWNTSRNCFVKIALEKLSKIVSNPLSHRCRLLTNKFNQLGITGDIRNYNPMRDTFCRNDIIDKEMVITAHLALQLALPTEQNGKYLLLKPDNNIDWLRKLYEKAIAGFYQVLLSSQGWEIKTGKRSRWQVSKQSSGILDILPTMQTDIELINLKQQKHIIIDTKFNEILISGNYREKSLRSGYVYQMYAYLHSQQRDCSAIGIILHPMFGEPLSEYAIIQQHKMQFSTVNLQATAIEIRQQLLDIINNALS